MKYFIRDIGSTFCMLAIFFPIAFFLSSFQEINNRCAQKYKYVERHSDEIKTLFIGHSHFENSLNPSIFDSSYILAQSARVSYYDLKLLEHFVPQMDNLRTVVYPLAYEGEVGQFFLFPSDRMIQMYEYKIGMDIDYPLEYCNFSNNVDYLVKCFAFHRKCARNNDTLGYYSLSDEVSNTKEVYVASNRVEDLTINLISMAKICEEHNVRFIIVTCPCNSTFLRESVTKKGIDQLYNIINNIRKMYPVEYHCYLNDSMFENDSLFYNQTHLNHNGATLFAQRLKEDFGL